MEFFKDLMLMFFYIFRFGIGLAIGAVYCISMAVMGFLAFILGIVIGIFGRLAAWICPDVEDMFTNIAVKFVRFISSLYV